MFGSRVIIAALMFASAALTTAGSVPRGLDLGNLGSIQCNAARLKIVGALGATKKAVSQIQDSNTQSAASAGLKQAQSGITQIAKALLTGQSPPADSRNQVEAGLNATGNALAAGSAGDSAVANAQKSLKDAVSAGDDVLANC